MRLEIFPVAGIGEVNEGDEVAALIVDALQNMERPLVDGDVVVVTHKIVSKAEGAVDRVEGDPEAYKRRLVEREARAILRRRGNLVITETKHGFVCANAGVDQSNAVRGTLVRLPEDPDRSANRVRVRLERAFGCRLAVIISDTFGRAWRRGLTDVAIGVSGMLAINDLRGTADHFGRVLEVTEVAVADELAAAAELVTGKSEGYPAAVVRGYRYQPGEGTGRDLVRTPSEDLFR